MSPQVHERRPYDTIDPSASNSNRLLPQIGQKTGLERSRKSYSTLRPSSKLTMGGMGGPRASIQQMN